MPTHSTTKPSKGSNAKQKENLNWKINYLAAQLGDKSRIPRANLAAKSLVKEKENGNLDEEAIRQQLLDLKAEKINKKIFHTTREIRKLMKKAKASEIQRLNKKAKAAKTLQENGENSAPKNMSKDSLEKIEREMTLVKTVDLDSISANATRNKVNKLGSVKHSGIASKLAFSADTPYVNSKDVPEDKAKSQRDLEARFLNFKPIKEEISRLVTDIDTILQAGSQTSVDVVEGAEDDDVEMEEDQADVYQDDDDEPEEKDATVPKRKQKAAPTSEKATKAKKATKSKRQSVEAESTFVSTLYSDSSDDSDVEEKTANKKQKKNPDDWTDDNFEKYYGAPKKNRAGQRARREKWEKLYGEEAKHVKASAEAEKAREERKLARQLKKSASGGNKTELGKKRPNASNESKSVKSKPVDEHLHPSWEAKKVQQDLMAKALSGSGGLGNKKIVFDDSD